MGNYKGTGVVFMRSLLQRQGNAVERRFLSQLAPQESEIYKQTLEFHWIPIEVITRFFEVAAPLVYPGDPNGLRRIGREMARDHLQGVYRIVLRVVTIEYIIERAARLWRTYHQTGTTRMERTGERLLHFVVVGYPELPSSFRECTCGYITGVLELAGAKDIHVIRSNDNQHEWRWKLSWN